MMVEERQDRELREDIERGEKKKKRKRKRKREKEKEKEKEKIEKIEGEKRVGPEESESRRVVNLEKSGS